MDRRRSREDVFRVTDKWRKDAQQARDDQGLTNAMLARELGCSKSALTKLFRPKASKSQTVRQSAVAVAVAKRLGVRMPDQLLPDTVEAVDILDHLRAHDPIGHEMALVMLQSIAEARRKAAAKSGLTATTPPVTNASEHDAVEGGDGATATHRNIRSPARKTRR